MAGLEGLNLGNLAAALRLTGVDPSFLADEEDQQLPPMEPSLPQNPYASTEPTIEQMDFNRRAPQGQLAEQRMASQNRALDLVGERQAVQEGAFDRQAGAARTMLDRRESGYQKAEQRVDMNTARTDDFRAQADAQLQSIIAKAKAPPEQKGQVLQIIASVLAASGKPGASAIGAGMQALAGSMQQSTQQWLAQLQAEDAAYRDTLAAAQDGRADSESFVRVQKELADLSYGVYGAALEEIKATAGSQDARLIAAEMQNNLFRGYTEEQMNINAGAQRARSGGMKQRQRDMLFNMNIDDLRTLIQSGEGGELAADVYKERAMGSLGIQGKEADIAAKRRAGGPASSPVSQGLVALDGATENDKKQAQKIVAAQSQLDSALQTMQNLQDSSDPDDKDLYDIQWKLAVGALNSMANAGVLNPGELADWEKRLPRHKYNNWYRPKAWVTDEKAVIKGLRDSFKAVSDKALRSYNFERMDGGGLGDIPERPVAGR